MKVYFDGSCIPNPGSMGACVVFENGETFSSLDYAYGTNNLAEWSALIWACQLCEEKSLTDVTFIGDSKLVIMQASDEWKIKQPEFLSFKQKVDRFKTLAQVKLVHVLRDYNLAGHYLESVGR